MSASKSIAAGGLLILLVTACTSCSGPSDTRSVAPVSFADTTTAPAFSREMSTGLFVGVRDFPRDRTMEVPFAVDDAIDLAYRFSLDQRVGLIPPRRVVLAISGSPQKEESRRRLHELEQARARIVRNVTAADILDLLKEQSARAGDNGMFVLSVASHGYQQRGDAYILGSTSTFDSPQTSLRTATLFDVASVARRSLIFLDACRERIGAGARGIRPDPATAAPLIRRMRRVEGQVIFYAAAAGEYAYDDPAHQNGVFTKAVLDGLNCQASAPHGSVLVETLHHFVDRQVRNWIRDNKHHVVNPATQINMEGETRNMPLCECWRAPGPRIRVAIDRTIVTAYAEDTRPLWRNDFGEPIIGAVAADLDADSFYEVVIGLHDRILALDRDGKTLWTNRADARTLRAFTTGDLFEKHTNQVVALWNDEHTSRVTVLDPDGSERASWESGAPLEYVAIGRPTNMHAPKIVVASSNLVMLLHVRKLAQKPVVWKHAFRSGDAIEELRIADANHDNRRDIAVATAGGTRWLTFDGKILFTKPRP